VSTRRTIACLAVSAAFGWRWRPSDVIDLSLAPVAVYVRRNSLAGCVQCFVYCTSADPITRYQSTSLSVSSIYACLYVGRAGRLLHFFVVR